MDRSERIIVALDTGEIETARAVVEKLAGGPRWFKIGMELFYAAGWQALEMVKATGANVFLDLKFHDIPNTVAGAARSCARAGVGMFNMHASAGLVAMKEVASEAMKVKEATGKKPVVIGVTVLTSIDQAALNEEVGMAGTVVDNVVRLALVCQKAGLDGVVASPLETRAIKEAAGKDFIVVAPGIRPAWSVAGDQKRFTTPAQALHDGADYIVIGRPITAAQDPREAFSKVVDEIK